MTPIPSLTDDELTAAIELLRSKAYLNLSKTHNEHLEMLELEASVRNLKV